MFDNVQLNQVVHVVACGVPFTGIVEDFEVDCHDERCMVLDVDGTFCEIWEKDVDSLDIIK
jgi:hypothetical protein